jgi:hypothetical protein
MTKVIAAAIALAAAASLAMTKHTPAMTRQEHDPDQRAVCVWQLLSHDGETTFDAGMVIGTLNYTDKRYGGPCAALEHLLVHKWY